MKRFVYIFSAVFTLLILAGCRKYPGLEVAKNPAYFRFFSNIKSNINVFNDYTTSAKSTYGIVTLLIDPQLDGNKTPSNAGIIGDYIYPRKAYSISYPADAGNTANPVNYEYPGNQPVPAGTIINGFQVSSWAQIANGTHHIQVVARTPGDTPFVSLPAYVRQKVLIDTVVNLEAGEVYTMEALVRDIDFQNFGLYVRKEDFIHQHFDTNKSYVEFYNLSSSPSTHSNTPFSTDTIAVYGSAYYSILYLNNPAQDTFQGYYVPYPPFNKVYMSTIAGKFSTSAPFQALPSLPAADFMDPHGNFQSYLNNDSIIGNTVGIPYFFFQLSTPSLLNFGLYCVDDPVLINLNGPYDPTQGSLSPNTNYYSGEGYSLTSSLYLINTKDGQTSILPTVNILELINDSVYHLQIIR